MFKTVCCNFHLNIVEKPQPCSKGTLLALTREQWEYRLGRLIEFTKLNGVDFTKHLQDTNWRIEYE